MNKERYEKPAITIIEMETESSIMQFSVSTDQIEDAEEDTSAYSSRKKFWEI